MAAHAQALHLTSVKSGVRNRVLLHVGNVHAVGNEQFAQLDGILEANATNACSVRANDVHGLVVNEQSAICLDAELLQRRIIDFLMGFAQLNKTGDQLAIQLLQDVTLFLGHMEQAGLPVAQSPYSDAGSLEVVDQHARAGHNAGQGIAEVLDVIVEDVGPLVALCARA